MEMRIETKVVKGRQVDYVYCLISGIDVCIGYVDGFGRLHIKN